MLPEDFDFYDDDYPDPRCPMRNCKGHLVYQDEEENPSVRYLACDLCNWIDPESYQTRDPQEV